MAPTGSSCSRFLTSTIRRSKAAPAKRLLLASFRLRGIRDRVLVKESRELVVELPMLCPQRARPLKECFGRDREKLRRMRRAVGVEHGRSPSVIRFTQRVELAPHDARPREVFGARRQ